MILESEPRGKSERVRDAAVQAYNYIFYAIDQDDLFWLFMHADKSGTLKSYPGLRELFQEGTPTISGLGSFFHGELPIPDHGGPLGFEVYINFWEPFSKRGVRSGDGVKYTVYHEGTSFIQQGQFKIKPFYFFTEPRENERPMEEKDIGGLKGAIKLIQSVYYATNPWRYQYLKERALRNGWLNELG